MQGPSGFAIHLREYFIVQGFFIQPTKASAYFFELLYRAILLNSRRLFESILALLRQCQELGMTAIKERIKPATKITRAAISKMTVGRENIPARPNSFIPACIP